ncbi:hypothetical protein [Paracoccus pantotrophus]|uniref:hypothetical protein n=1 Tax=Paracoccus pantotrophus TaxID=82367 RepID=UPI000688E5F8|nr:hypothetical protein [Paracoccus pantotrophus]
MNRLGDELRDRIAPRRRLPVCEKLGKLDGQIFRLGGAVRINDGWGAPAESCRYVNEALLFCRVSIGTQL